MCVCVCRCALCVPNGGDTMAVPRSPQLKPRDEVKSGNERREVLRVKGREGAECCCMILGSTNRSDHLYQVALHPCDHKRKRRHGNVVCWGREWGLEKTQHWGVKDERRFPKKIGKD